MNGSDVAWGEMNFRGLSDADIEALIAGEPAAGAPSQLSELVGGLRSEFDTTPAARVGTALGEFIDIVDLTTTPTVAAASRPGGLGTKAVAVFGALSLKVLLGAAVAAASVGGAQALGVIDVPGLPNRAPATQVDVPGPPLDVPGEGPAQSEPDRFVPDSDPGLGTGLSGADGVVVEPSVSQAGNSEAGEGCEFGQQTTESGTDGAADNRPADGLSVDPCNSGQAPTVVASDQVPTGPRNSPETILPGRTGQGPAGRPEDVSPGRGEDAPPGLAENISPDRTPRSG